MSQRMIEMILFLAALLLAGVATHAYLVSRSEEQKLQATLASQNQIISAASTRQQQRDTALASTLADIAKQKAAKQSPQELAEALAKVLALPQPIQLAPDGVSAQAPNASHTVSESSKDSPSGKLSFAKRVESGSLSKLSNTSPSSSRLTTGQPNSRFEGPNNSHSTAGLESSRPPEPSQGAAARPSASSVAPCAESSKCPQAPEPTELPVELPVNDLKPIYNFALDCRACQAQLAVAKQNATDDAAKIAALTRERDAAVTAAKGGTWLRRLRRNAIWFAAGAATAYAASHR